MLEEDRKQPSLLSLYIFWSLALVHFTKTYLSFTRNMSKLSLLLLVSFLTLYMAGTAESAVTQNSNPTDFIKASCMATRYPEVCVECLSGYASVIRQSQQQLAQTALSVSLARAQSAAKFVAILTRVRGIRPREHQAVADCIENMADSVDRLSQSVAEIDHMSGAVGQNFVWHMSNVQTWVSAALTDADTCFDGFSGRSMDGSVKDVVRRRVLGVDQVTSNALALVNGFAARHRKP